MGRNEPIASESPGLRGATIMFADSSLRDKIIRGYEALTSTSRLSIKRVFPTFAATSRTIRGW